MQLRSGNETILIPGRSRDAPPPPPTPSPLLMDDWDENTPWTMTENQLHVIADALLAYLWEELVSSNGISGAMHEWFYPSADQIEFYKLAMYFGDLEVAWWHVLGQCPLTAEVRPTPHVEEGNLDTLGTPTFSEVRTCPYVIKISPSTDLSHIYIPTHGVLIVYMVPGKYYFEDLMSFGILNISVLLIGTGPGTYLEFENGMHLVRFTSQHIVGLQNLIIGRNTMGFVCDGTLVMDCVVNVFFLITIILQIKVCLELCLHRLHFHRIASLGVLMPTNLLELIQKSDRSLHAQAMLR
jgi:hypothetical protein